MPYQSAPCSSLSCWTSSAGLIALFEIRGPHLTRVNMVAGALALATTPCPMTKKAGCTRGSVHRATWQTPLRVNGGWKPAAVHPERRLPGRQTRTVRTATFSRDPMTAPTRIWRLPKVPLALTPYASQLSHWSFSPAAMGAMRTSRPAAEKLGAVRQDPDLDDLLFRLISRATGGRQEHAARAGRPVDDRGRTRVKGTAEPVIAVVA